jgi:4-hydroxyacetophenone monooxygenase
MKKLFVQAVADEKKLRSALDGADIAPTLMSLVHLSGDMTILDEVAPHIKGAWSFLESVPEELKAKVRDQLVTVLKDYAASGKMPPKLLPSQTLRRMMSAVVGEKVAEEYVPLLIEEMRLNTEDARGLNWRVNPATLALKQFKVVIVGAGFAGICAAIRLQEASLPFVILEKNDRVGGTWYENAYPGCGVDTPNHFFSYSFNPNNNWSHHFSKRDEIWKYIEDTAEKYALHKHIRFGVEVTGAEFNEKSGLWKVGCRNADGSSDAITGNAVITAVGQLNRPSIPDIKGMDEFSGPHFHTASWDRTVDLKGKRVAMIGTGASAMQAAPTIAPDVAKLTIFQRSPHWAMHNPNYHKKVSEGHQWALQNIPFYSEWQRFQLFWSSAESFHESLRVDPQWPHADVSLNEKNHQVRENLIAHIRSELGDDEELIAKCIPAYPPYGKRMLRENHWYKMLKRPNVDLVTTAISHVTRGAIAMKDGTVHPVDVIIMATGFQAARILWPMDIKGRKGVTIRSVWGDEDPRAYKGMTVPGFPNLFVTYGPNTNPGPGGSTIFYFECQIRYMMQVIREMVEKGYSTIEVRREVHDEYNVKVDEKCRNMVWSHPRVNSWYKNSQNRITVNSPWRQLEYWQLTRTFDPDDYIHATAKPRSADGSEPDTDTSGSAVLSDKSIEV